MMRFTLSILALLLLGASASYATTEGKVISDCIECVKNQNIKDISNTINNTEAQKKISSIQTKMVEAIMFNRIDNLLDIWNKNNIDGLADQAFLMSYDDDGDEIKLVEAMACPSKDQIKSYKLIVKKIKKSYNKDNQEILLSKLAASCMIEFDDDPADQEAINTLAQNISADVLIKAHCNNSAIGFNPNSKKLEKIISKKIPEFKFPNCFS